MPNDQSLAHVLRPIEGARGLPNAHYTSEEMFAREREALWVSTWAGICVAAQVPQPGDAIPIDYLGVPLFVLRGRDGVVRVFQNVCRHRGMILVTEPRRIEGAIRCPYHSWCYSHEGRLVATPHVGGPGHNTHPDMKREELGSTGIGRGIAVPHTKHPSVDRLVGTVGVSQEALPHIGSFEADHR